MKYEIKAELLETVSDEMIEKEIMDTIARYYEFSSLQDLETLAKKTGVKSVDEYCKKSVAIELRKWFRSQSSPNLIDKEIGLYKKLINQYQSFTKWILRHDSDIAKSKRGFDHLMDIDEIEKQIRESELKALQNPVK